MQYAFSRGEEKVKEYDHVELLVEKERYAQYGVHKGMSGIICDPRRLHGTRLVCFDEEAYFDEFPILTVREEDLKVIRQAEGAL